MKRLRALFERLRGGRRPPTGPLTTAERATADDVQQKAAAKEVERAEREARGES